MKWFLIVLVVHVGVCFAQLLDPIRVANKEKCEEIGGPGTYEKLQAATTKTKACISDLFDMSTITIEIEKAKRTGSLDGVFAKHCAKMDQLNVCLRNEADILKLCLEEEYSNYFPIFENMWRKFGEFACTNDGKRIASFIESGGMECLKSRMDHVSQCVMKTIPFDTNLLSNFGIINLETANKSCEDYVTVQKCVVSEMETNCPDKVPAETFDKFFKVMQDDLCKDNKILRRKRSLRRVVRNIGGMTNKLPHIEAAIKSSCVKNGHPSDKLEQDLSKFKVCLQKKRLFVAPKHEYLSNFENCSKETIDLLEKCLPDRFKYFPIFMFNLAKSIISLLYDDFIIIGSELGPCLPKLKQEEHRLSYETCVDNAGQMHDDELPPSKAAFCAKFIPASECFTNQLREVCKHSAELDKFRADYMKAMERPCN